MTKVRNSDMRIVFLGVGEAFDENLINSSILISSDTKFLLDCGYAVPRHLWRHYPNKDFLDAIYLSHAHADHYMGIPLLLSRMLEENRVKPLTFVGQRDICKAIPLVMEYSYRGLFNKLPFKINFIEIEPRNEVVLNELKLEFAPSKHSVSNFAIKVQCGEKSFCYSGDGRNTEASAQLYIGTELLIHEAYTLHEVIPTHGNIQDVIQMAEKIGVKNLALIHLNRDVRRDKERVLNYIKEQADRVNVILPEQMDEYEV